MSLLNNGVEARSGLTHANAPPLPGDGPVVHMVSAGPMLIVARLAPGDLLANCWSWSVGDNCWQRNWIA